MNELTLLQTLREDVPEPTPEHLAPAFSKLSRTMQRHATPDKRRPRARWALAGIAGAAAITLVSGNAAMAAESAHAASVLQDLANQTISFVDPAPGEYLLSHTHADWATSSLNSDGSVSSAMNEQTIDVYMPSDPDADWILYRDWGDISGITGQGNKETIRAEGGTFYDDSPWLVMDFDDIPLGTGEETLAYFDEQYFGGNASRDEDNFVRIVDVLASGLVPAKQRASLFEALALIPGVTSTNDVANFDGDKGIAIGRTEVLRGGVRDEIILDPKTGLVIGERQMTTIALFGFGINTVLNATAVETSVVDTAP